jgi:BirA family biotin operon repressor/biotin-[acetyl-CoA-carboxylase] ligase
MHPFNIIRLKQVESTNTWAKEALAEGAIPVNTVIVAETQTAGRGQLLTKWHDEPGKNLIFTLVFKPKQTMAHQYFRINAAVSLALMDALHGIEGLAVKWPNDIIVNEKKLAGILIETLVKGDKIDQVNAGIGLNVNQLQFPDGLNATSLALEQHTQVNLDELLFKLLTELNNRINDLANSSLITNYNNKLFGRGEELCFEDNSGQFKAKVIGVDDDGLLNLKISDEHPPRSYRFKEVKWL